MERNRVDPIFPHFIMLKPNPFCDKIKERQDTKVFYLMKENFKEIKEEIINLLK